MHASSKLRNRISRLLKDRRGQDLIEYALMGGFVSVGCGAILPPVVPVISGIFSKVVFQLTRFNG